jgi:hypothetical protein
MRVNFTRKRIFFTRLREKYFRYACVLVFACQSVNSKFLGLFVAHKLLEPSLLTYDLKDTNTLQHILY